MTKTELLLYKVLVDIWPRCPICSNPAQYKPAAGGYTPWYCEQHVPVEAYQLHNGKYEQAPGWEAMMEMSSAVLDLSEDE